MKSNIIIFLCLISHAIVPTLSLKLYEIVCSELLHDNGHCFDELQADSRINSATNYQDLSKFILDMAITEATRAHRYLIKNLNRTPNDPAIAQCASAFYNKCIGALRSSMSEMVQDPQSAIDDTKIAGDQITNCDNALQAQKTRNRFAIGVLNKEALLLTEISVLALTHLTHSGGL
ncbi:plant invertase/pectin methylesterase inhibitor protein [Trifolium pratense]|uniref:Uncharacterized protein n=2 Tax=Trifolium pratense TaxID=57577 RepID=A0ACB0LAG0_TRIPR|nr:plant invertase/pectin methylesterase inhibitor protein [Trifolium pratense]CAJ2666330.1 unnamed protein product [Trifolium pratense]